MLTLLKVIVFSIPENIVIIGFACGLLGITIPWKRWISISIILAIIAYVFRLKFDSFIIYSLLSDVSLIILFKANRIASWFHSTIVVILSNYTYILVEFIALHILQIFFKLDPLMIIESFWLSILCFFPQLLMVALLSYVIRSRNYSIFDLNG